MISFPKLEKALKEKLDQEKAEEKGGSTQGSRAPLATAPETDLLYQITPAPSLTYGDGPDFDQILKEGDEFIERTYSMMEASKEEEEKSQSFVILGREDQEVPSSIYENITQDLKEVMPNELYLPTSRDKKVSGRKPKLPLRGIQL